MFSKIRKVRKYIKTTRNQRVLTRSNIRKLIVFSSKSRLDCVLAKKSLISNLLFYLSNVVNIVILKSRILIVNSISFIIIVSIHLISI